MNAALANRVKQAIEGRERAAVDVQNELGITHEQVYAALAWLEQRDMAEIVFKNYKRQNYQRLWTAVKPLR